MTRLLVSGLVLDQPMGGVRRHNEQLLPRLARLLAADGGHLAVLAPRGGIALELGDEVEVIPSDVPSRPIPVRAVLESRALSRLVRERGFDRVHTAHLPAPRGLDVPLSLTIHDLRSLELAHTPFSRRLMARHMIGRALERASLVCTVSEFTAARLTELFAGVASKLVLVPNAADHFEPLPRAPGPGSKLCHLGHLEPRKNLELLVRALALDPSLPPLLLAGTAKGEERARLEALAGELGVDVEFTGPYSEEQMPSLLATSAAVVIPSKLEGFGIPALEAMRAGAPLAVSRAGALPEVVGLDVPTFDPEDPADCVRAIRQALEGTVAYCPADRSWDDSAKSWLEALG